MKAQRVVVNCSTGASSTEEYDVLVVDDGPKKDKLGALIATLQAKGILNAGDTAAIV